MASRASAFAFRSCCALPLRAAGLALLLVLLPSPLFCAATRSEADALLAKGRQWYEKEDYLGSREPLRQALDAYEDLGDAAGKADASLALGALLVDLGEYQQALKLLSQAKAAWQGLGNREKEAEAPARLTDRYADATQYYQEALTIYRKLGDELGEGYTFQGLGEVSGMITCRGPSEEADGYRREAPPHLEKALRDLRAAGRKRQLYDLL